MADKDYSESSIEKTPGLGQLPPSELKFPPGDPFEFVNSFHKETLARNEASLNSDGSVTTVMAMGVPYNGQIYMVPGFNRETGEDFENENEAKKFWLKNIQNGDITGIPDNFNPKPFLPDDFNTLSPAEQQKTLSDITMEHHPANRMAELNHEKNIEGDLDGFDPVARQKAIKWGRSNIPSEDWKQRTRKHNEEEVRSRLGTFNVPIPPEKLDNIEDAVDHVEQETRNYESPWEETRPNLAQATDRLIDKSEKIDSWEFYNKGLPESGKFHPDKPAASFRRGLPRNPIAEAAVTYNIGNIPKGIADLVIGGVEKYRDMKKSK